MVLEWPIGMAQRICATAGTAHPQTSPPNVSGRSLWGRHWADDGVDSVEHLIDLSVPSEFLLREHELVSSDHLEDSAFRRDQGDVLYVMLELAEYRFSHAHGTVCVASRGAVFNR